MKSDYFYSLAQTSIQVSNEDIRLSAIASRLNDALAQKIQPELSQELNTIKADHTRIIEGLTDNIEDIEAKADQNQEVEDLTFEPEGAIISQIFKDRHQNAVKVINKLKAQQNWLDKLPKAADTTGQTDIAELETSLAKHREKLLALEELRGKADPVTDDTLQSFIDKQWQAHRDANLKIHTLAGRAVAQEMC